MEGLFPDYLLRMSHAYVVPPVLGVLVLIALALISLLRGRRNPVNILFAIICSMGALINADLALVNLIDDKNLAIRIDRWTYVVFVFSLPVYIQFVHAFLDVKQRRWLVALAYAVSLIFLFFTPTDLFIRGFRQYTFGIIAQAGKAFHLFSLFVAFTVTYCLATLAVHLRRETDNLQKNRIKYILGGMGLSTVLIALNILPVIGVNVYPMGNFSFLPAVVLAFGILKYDLLDIGAVIRRGVVYFALIAVLTFLYILIISAFNVLFMDSAWRHSVALPFSLALLMVFLFNPIRLRVQASIDRLFFRGRYDYRKLIGQVSAELSSLMNVEQVRGLLLKAIAGALPVEGLYLLVFREDEERYVLFPEGAGMVGIPSIHPIVALLEDTRRPWGPARMDQTGLSERGQEEILALFERLQAVLAVPMISQGRLLGMIVLGQKKTGELFVHEDIELLTTIANQSATAMENASIYEKLEILNLELERKVEERTADLRLALAEKERTQRQLIQSESLAAIGQLVAGTAHELNNPLASASSLVQTSVEVISGWPPAAGDHDEVLDDLRFSLKELQRAGAIVQSLLGLTRQTQTYMEPVQVNVAIDDALRVLHNQYKFLPVTIDRDYDPALPEVQGNYANLGQVFINIIKNAIQALSEGKGRIVLVTRFFPEENRAVISCRDTGRGIPPGQLKDVFKPFFTTKGIGRGTGLGLYISHEIVQRHGGEIGIMSVEGQGTEVTVKLPCRRGAL